VFSAAFASFARIRETCFKCKEATAVIDGTDFFLPETENYTISVCFLYGFRTSDKVPGLNFMVAGVRIMTGTPGILVQFLHFLLSWKQKSGDYTSNQATARVFLSYYSLSSDRTTQKSGPDNGDASQVEPTNHKTLNRVLTLCSNCIFMACDTV
jgi:hypothetical protein